KCLLIDDEPLALQQLVSYVGKIPYLELVKACSGPTEAMEVMANEKVDVIFTDIEMPDINGLEYIRSLKDKPIIVFVTAYANFAIEGFQVDATDYLLKPFSLTDFMRCAEKVKQQHDLRMAATSGKEKPAGADKKETSESDEKKATQGWENEYVFVRADSRTVRLKISDIQYIESRKEYVVIFSQNSLPVMTLFSLKSIEEKLPKDVFMRVHRSFIVNLTKITEVVQNRIVFGKDASVPLGDQYKKDFQNFLNQNFLK
ncbi:MAG TPA: LytTR family DNA-binding domain-containing protein, partial [Bacteroidales bacterium]|nr:LytTR family DNA-binding domain-containing protein [Bacteroidales bacterium]HNW22019.1 LytTR family DNA-binding domain-containing protein [Bacteroidales bacterium]HOZ10607.1 LytTR family DNA-binding domain-containing protein [Bacteroidales bacterium]HPM16812.1 LytTR family DNA-binding domain-containing protein [Bacteroidales bacterium]HPU83606.1 LytTR family DNA-binding domain-containing protein [Bacteroidales bacterium]